MHEYLFVPEGVLEVHERSFIFGTIFIYLCPCKSRTCLLCIVYFVYIVDLWTECLPAMESPSPPTIGIVSPSTMGNASPLTTGIVIAVVLCFTVVLVLIAVVLIVLWTCRWKGKQRHKVGSFSFCTDWVWLVELTLGWRCYGLYSGVSFIMSYPCSSTIWLLL